MNNESILIQKKIEDLEFICKELDSINSFSSKIDGNWNDEVSIEVQNKILSINKKKNELINELKKLETILKKSRQ